MTVRDLSYGLGERRLTIGAGRPEALVWNLRDSHPWYGLSVSTAQRRRRLAGGFAPHDPPTESVARGRTGSS